VIRENAKIPRTPKLKAKPAVRVQYGALPYRYSADASLEILLVTTRQSRRWIIPGSVKSTCRDNCANMSLTILWKSACRGGLPWKASVRTSPLAFMAKKRSSSSVWAWGRIIG
jgi:hypothetical protein